MRIRHRKRRSLAVDRERRYNAILHEAARREEQQRIEAAKTAKERADE